MTTKLIIYWVLNMSGTPLSALHTLFILFFTKSLWDIYYYYSHMTGKDTEEQREGQ